MGKIKTKEKQDDLPIMAFKIYLESEHPQEGCWTDKERHEINTLMSRITDFKHFGIVTRINLTAPADLFRD